MCPAGRIVVRIPCKALGESMLNRVPSRLLGENMISEQAAQSSSIATGKLKNMMNPARGHIVVVKEY
jgi:hypothetical protein